jgi:hypothetical protein
MTDFMDQWAYQSQLYKDQIYDDWTTDVNQPDNSLDQHWSMTSYINKSIQRYDDTDNALDQHWSVTSYINKPKDKPNDVSIKEDSCTLL